MVDSDDMPTMAELLRARGAVKRRRPAVPVERAPGLFDSAPADAEIAVSRVAAEVVVSAAVVPEMVAAPAVSYDEAERTSEMPRRAEPAVWTVGELVRQVRGLVERSYGHIWVEGEISNWRPAGSGHCYFTLKDGEAQLSVVMFRKQAMLLRFRPKDGDAVRLAGQLSVYESRGQMQLVAERMEQVGLGALLAAVRALKERLRREGLFDRKRPLPPFPRCIGVVTSVQGAALRDIVKVCRRRHAAVNLLIYPAAVQGPRCGVEVAAGVRWFSQRVERGEKDRVDVVLVARGGGSWEDLHGFDDERVARAIAACAVPVIAGIGHATDSTIADAAADVCAPTPSAAAELLTAAQHRVGERVEQMSARLRRAARFEMLRVRQRLSRLSAEYALRRVRDALQQRSQRVDEAGFRAEAAARRMLRARGARLARAEARLQRQSVERRTAEQRRRLETLEQRLRAAPAGLLARRGARVERVGARLEALSPLRVLERGYALVYGPEGRLLRSADEVEPGAEIVARLAEGRLAATVRGRK